MIKGEGNGEQVCKRLASSAYSKLETKRQVGRKIPTLILLSYGYAVSRPTSVSRTTQPPDLAKSEYPIIESAAAPTLCRSEWIFRFNHAVQSGPIHGETNGGAPSHESSEGWQSFCAWRNLGVLFRRNVVKQSTPS